ncbi:sulfite exporter TauE/SafE family protein [Cytobacillus firmus]|uniref:sulfite exporter TauE/SafE family protein n=1 Tax=Cytobacillus firmus TaxID=1399 RepID=UPI002163F259|nr:sulfite exporter TauE/SafE family protein [Cytobacillus firmus]MCS0673841.1 sulfite exporter TauE/SafE family protein [Cytobacillus firmus]
MASLIAVLFAGLLLGIKHALEPDHIVAVSTIAVRSKSMWKSSLAGVYWGIGHTFTLFLFGIFLILMKQNLSEQAALTLEFFVGIMLVYLGLAAMFKKYSEKEMEQNTGNSNKKSVFIGFVHGLAGSAAMVLLTMSVSENIWQGALYILAFGFGTVIGMLSFSALLSVPVIMAKKRKGISGNIIKITGVISFCFGLYYMYNLGFTEGLFTYWL